MQFVNLHRHDQFSIFDGLGTAKDAAARAAELEQPALALTNHGGVFGFVDHYFSCREAGIEPIVGSEVYYKLGEKEKPAHLTVLASSQIGFQNLMKLVTKSYQYFYYKPQVTTELLEEHAEGLIVLSGCRSGVFGKMMTDGKVEEADRFLDWLALTFGDAAYLEVQPHPEYADLFAKALYAGRKVGLRPVITTDSHYVLKEDKVVHDALLRSRDFGKSKGEENPTYGDGFHLVSAVEALEMARRFLPFLGPGEAEELVSNTLEIAGRCSLVIQKPEKPLPDTSWDEFHRKAWRGFGRRGLEAFPAYKDRLERELEVVQKMGLAAYFSTVASIVGWAKDEGIMVGPRGSVCGSLLAYVLRIHDVDPIRHRLTFERFLHEDKKTLPDIDLDFDARHRGAVVEHVIKSWDGLAYPIATFGRYAAGNLANDCVKLFGIGASDAKLLRKALDDVRGEFKAKIDDEMLDASPSVQAVVDSHPDLRWTLKRLFGQVRYVGRHPGGVCLFPTKEHWRWMALAKQQDRWTTTGTFVDVERLGLVKLDLLGLDALSTLSKVAKMVEDRHGDPIDWEKLSLDDQSVYRLLSKGRTDGVFQLDTRIGRSVAAQIGVEDFGDLVAAVSLGRPGVSAQIEAYVRGKEMGTYGSETILEKATVDTYGALVYQEQVMWILRQVGLPWTSVDRFLKSVKGLGSFTIGKDASERQGDIRYEVSDALKAHGWKDADAEELVNQLSGYYFNRAHATGYALTAYRMAWARVHYPLEFWASILDSETKDVTRLALEMSASRDGVVFLPPHANGTAGYSIEDNAIRVGLKSVKGLGEKLAERVASKRPYRSKAHFRESHQPREVNSKAVQVLEEVGALEFEREKMVELAVGYNRLRKPRRFEEDEA